MILITCLAYGNPPGSYYTNKMLLAFEKTDKSFNLTPIFTLKEDGNIYIRVYSNIEDSSKLVIFEAIGIDNVCLFIDGVSVE